MASSEVKPVPEGDKIEPSPPETFVRTPSSGVNRAGVEVVLRILLFATTLTAVMLMVTSKQTKQVPVPALLITVSVPARFKDSPAFIYYVAAYSVVGLYSIISTLASLSALSNPRYSKISLHLALLDAVMLGLAASATGTAGGIAYVGFKGNSNVNWGKICNTFDKFCRYIAVSLSISLISSVLLLLLVILSTHSLYSRLRR